MRLSNREHDSLMKFARSKSMSEVNASMRTKIIASDPRGSDLDLKKWGRDLLTQLIAVLPSGTGARITSPLLSSVRDKAKTSLAGLKTPHLDPTSYPQIYRMQTKLNNSRAGIKKGPMGQYLRLHPKGMSVSLTGDIVWNDHNSGDLHIMGTWADISKAITDGGTGLALIMDFDDIYADDVNAQMDAMLGTLGGDDDWLERRDDMVLTVSCQSSAKWTKADREGEVVLNAPKEIIELAVGRTTGVLGQIPTSTALSVSGDTAGLALGMVGPDRIKSGASKLVQMTGLTRAPDKSLYTITVGIGPASKKCVMADTKRITGATLLELATAARDTETG